MSLIETSETVRESQHQEFLESMKLPRAVVIISGGIDSTVALHWAKWRFDVLPLIFLYGQRHLREVVFASAQCQKLNLTPIMVRTQWMEELQSSALTNPSLKIPEIREVLGHPQPVTYVPFRNQLFLTIACQFAEDREARAVIYGAQLHDLYGYWDATSEFVEKFNSLISLNRQHRLRVIAPLSGNSKADNIRLGHELGVNFKITYSCYEGHAKHCGVCPTCAERKKGFIEAGITDPTEYEQ